MKYQLIVKNIISTIKVKTRSIRLFYPLHFKFFILHKFVALINLISISNKNKEKIANIIESIIISKSTKEKIYWYSYSIRMLAAKTYCLIRSVGITSEPIKNNNKIVESIKKDGHSNDLKINISPQECNQVINYFSSQPSVFGHAYAGRTDDKYHEPLNNLKAKKESLPKYITYSEKTQFNCSELLNIAINPSIIEIAQSYFGCIPKIEFINTFWTLPSDESPWLADYHRDFDDYLSLTFMINWTDTFENQSGTKYIKGSHRPSPELTSKLLSSGEEMFVKDKINGMNDEEIFDLFRNSSVPGYKQNERYEKIFSKSEDYLNSSGRQGTISCANNEGLHCGPKFEGERLISWVRYGNSGGYPGRSIDMTKVILSKTSMEIISSSKYGFIIEELLS
jgi:hypothetical protein